MQRFVLLLLSLVTFVVPSTAQSPADSSALLARFEKNYRSARSLQATFLEEYFENGKQTRANSGTAYFLKPGRMRWEYEHPEKSLFLVDGKSAWFYVPADRTVTHLPVQGSDDWRTPFAFLAGELKLSKLCSRVIERGIQKGTSEDEHAFECAISAPKSASLATKSEFQRVFFALTREGHLASIRVESPGGIRMEFRFRNWEFNPRLPESSFHLDVPPGVTIVNGMLPSGSPVRQ